MTRQEQAESARKMETYAGMVDRIDQNIGKLINHLKATDQYDNTLIFFMSNNGAEGSQFGAWPVTAGGGMGAHVARYHDNSIENMGAYNSFVWYGTRWARKARALLGVCYTRCSRSKAVSASPMIMRYPSLVRTPGTIDHGFATCMDILPTILDAYGVEHPGTYRSRQVAPVTGQSWVPYLRQQREEIHGTDHVTGWELFGRRALRQGGLKALYIPIPYGPEKWQFFNILDDPGETKDLADQQPEKPKEMVGLYEDYCRGNGVTTQRGIARRVGVLSCN